MVARLPIVEQLLGTPLDQVSSDHLAAAVQNRLPEGPDLDFKGAHYGSGDKDRQELAKDVAAFANHAGGVIVLGISDEDGVASGITPVELSDNRRRGMLQSLRRWLTPFVPELDILPVKNGTDSSNGFYLIVVGRSARAPHAVVTGSTEKPVMSWPVRLSTTTRYLHEVELSEFYRNRFEGSAGRHQMLDRIVSDAAKSLNLPAGPWVVMGLVPEMPGEVPLGVAGLHRTQDVAKEWLAEAWSEGILSEKIAWLQHKGYSVGVRRVAFNSEVSHTNPPSRAYFECHCDGSCVAAVGRLMEQFPSQAAGALMQVEIEAMVLELLHFTSFYATRARAGGEARIRTTLLLPPDHGLWLAENMLEFQTGYSKDVPSRLLNTGFELPDVTFPLDELTRISGVARAAHLIAQDLVSSFGLPKVRLLNADGLIDPTVQGVLHIQEWADSAGLLPTSAG